jgi:branched-chain amino acid transport system substrate-binding protein
VKTNDLTKLSGTVAVLLITLVISACGGGGSAGEGDTVVFGSHVPLTGPLAAGGEQLSAGADAYFKHINDQGGGNGHKIEYQAVNDAYDPQKAVAAARQLVERDGAVAIVSTLGTATGLAVAPYLEAQNVAYVASLSGDRRLLGDDPESPVFGIAPTGLQMGGSLGSYAVEEYDAKRVAAFYQNDAYGTDGRDGFREEAEAAGAEYVADAPHEVDATEFSAQIRALRNAQPDVVVLYTLPSTAAAFLKQAKDQGFDEAQFIAPNPMTDPIMVGLTGNALDGLTCNFFTAVNGSVNKEVAAKEDILKEYHPDVDGGYYSFQGMAGAMVAVEALKQIDGEVTNENFIEALEQVSVDPKVTAPIEYGPNDHAGVSEFGFARWEGGNIKVLSEY